MITLIPSEKNGSILVIVMVLMVAFSLMTLALLQLGAFNETETINQLRITQAHWTAEAGLERVLSWIMASKDYRELSGLNATPSLQLNEDLPGMTNGNYSVWVSKTDIFGSEEQKFTIESIGTVSNAAFTSSATVQIQLIGAPGIDQALLGLGGDSEIHQNVTIDGTVYQSGSLIIHQNVEISDMVEAADDGTVVTGVDPDQLQTVEVITFPHLDRTPYETLINYAEDTNNTDVVQGDTTYSTPIDLNGGTIYVNGDITIKNDVIRDGTIVATGTITLDKPQLTIGSDVSLVANGDITFKQQTDFESNTEVFSMSDIIFRQSGETDAGTSLLAMGDVFIRASMDFLGVIYAEGEIDINAQSDLRGTIIAWDGFDIASNSSITYDPTVFANPNPIDWGNFFTPTQPLQWKKLRL